jgi:hypothetical protein
MLSFNKDQAERIKIRFTQQLLVQRSAWDRLSARPGPKAGPGPATTDNVRVRAGFKLQSNVV